MQKRSPIIVGFLSVVLVAACGGGTTQGEESEAGVEAPPTETTTGTVAEGRVTENTVAEDAVAGSTERYSFDEDGVDTPPLGFTTVHSGGGEDGIWQVVEAPDAPSGRRAVAQLGTDRTGSRFPLLVLDSFVARDVELAVAGKPISGTKDQAIGLIWRFQNADNYYVVRANALEDNVVLYKMEDGKRSDLDLLDAGRTYGLKVEVPAGNWSRLGVRVEGNRFTALLNGRELFQVEDVTFTGAGKVGLWTKADSVTWFDDLEVRSLDGLDENDSEQEDDGE